MKKSFLALALVITCLVSKPVHAEEKQNLENAKEGIVQINVVYRDDNNKNHIVNGGTGFLIGDDEQNVEYVVTCKHTVEPDKEYIKAALAEIGVAGDQIDNRADSVEFEVVVAKDVCKPASLVLSSDQLDMAVLQLSETLPKRKALPVFGLDEKETKTPYSNTDKVYSLGFPSAINYEGNEIYYDNDQVIMSSGVIMNMHDINNVFYITHDIEIGANNCGGPLLDEDGNVIGMTVLDKDGDYYLAVDASEMVDIFDSFGLKYHKVSAAEISPEKLTDNSEQNGNVVDISPVKKTEMPLAWKLAIVFTIVFVVIATVVVIILIKQKDTDGNKKERKSKKDKKKDELKKPFETKITPSVSPIPSSGGGFETSVLSTVKNGETSVLNAGAAVSGKLSRGKLIRKKTGDNIDLTKERTVIGKDSLHADYCIRDNSAISRMHAILIANDTGVFIEDSRSTNGTYVNGRRLEQGEQIELKGGENVRLGNEEFIFRK